MTRFRDRQVDVLLATTVIEVGIDVPNATVILIDNADRFGLSQLHQLRGRVGRGSEPSHCLLIADAGNETAEARLKAMCDTNDGFEIAEMDLRLRGPGEFFGTRQHGLPEFKLADITSEMALLQEAKEDALALLEQDPRLTRPEHRHLRSALVKQLGETLALAQIG
jgi:ATP-dependent DNA helicase RecG